MNEKDQLEQLKIIAIELTKIRETMQPKAYLYCCECHTLSVITANIDDIIKTINTVESDDKLNDILKKISSIEEIVVKNNG